MEILKIKTYNTMMERKIFGVLSPKITNVNSDSFR